MTNVRPLVSIIIPVYNGEKYLSHAIESALAQTYKPLEIVIVNDGSTDNTEAIALKYGDKVKYYRKSNGGVSTALNLGIQKMQGDYFSWLSHDDLYHPNKIEMQIIALTGDPHQIVYSDYHVIDHKGMLITTLNILEKFPNSDLSIGLFPILRQVLNGCSLLIHRSHFDRVGLFDERLRVTQDYDLWFKMFRGQKLIYINFPLVMLREHSEQVTHSYDRNISESDELWLKMMNELTRKEIISICETEYCFWKDQYDFFRLTSFERSRDYAKSRFIEVGGKKVNLSSLFSVGIYKLLRFMSWIVRKLGIQSDVRKSRLFHWGYKIWLKVRYK